VQTFLPYSSFLASAAALDDRRLGKQRVETFQILRALVFPAYAWKNHPAVAMWRGFTPALVGYGLAVCAEWQRRGHADAVAASLLTFTCGRRPDLAALRLDGRLPPWLGDPELHRSHRSALLRKDPERYPHFAGEPVDLPYFWPRPLFARWPVRRSGPLPLEEALAAMKIEEAAPVEATLAALRDSPVAVEEPAVAMAVALTFPAPALWVTASPDVRADTPPAAPLAPPQHRPPGKVAASIARPPTEEDLAAVQVEAAADVGVVVHPRARLATAAVRRCLEERPAYVVVTEQPTGWRLSLPTSVSASGPRESRRRASASRGG